MKHGRILKYLILTVLALSLSGIDSTMKAGSRLGKVTGVMGEVLAVNLGSLHGIRQGLRGRVFKFDADKQTVNLQASVYVRPDGVIVRRSPIAMQRELNAARASRPAPGPRLIVETHKNTEVLEALTKLTGQMLGFDKERWLQWIKTNYREKAASVTN